MSQKLDTVPWYGVYIGVMKSESFTIGKLAQASGVGVETIRFYERQGILEQPKKQGGFRHYPPQFVERIKFVKRSQELGFTLKETKDLLGLRIKSHAKCGDVLVKTEEKIQEIDLKIKDLKKMKRSLEKLADCCEDPNIALSDCPVLENF